MDNNFYSAYYFSFFYFRNRTSGTSLQKIILLSACGGLIGGLLFDVIFGALGVFSYQSKNPNNSFYATGLSLYQLILNGIFSYGLAIATARYITPKIRAGKKDTIKKNTIKKDTALVLALLVLISFGLSFLYTFGISTLFMYGVGILALGECILVLTGKSGPFVSLVFTRNYSSFMRLWANSILIGFLYEMVNLLFPFWIWLPRFYPSQVGLEFLIIIFGYMALFHPIIVFWHTIETE